MANSTTVAKSPTSPAHFVLKPGVFRWVLLGLALIPVLLIFRLIAEFAVNAPVLDEWAMAAQVVKLHTGGFQLAELWAPHNEHRIFFLRLILIALAKLGGWNLVKEAYFNLFLAVLCLVALWKLLDLSFPKAPVLVAGLTFIMSWLVFAGVQADSWLVGWQMCFTMVNLAALLAVLALRLWTGKFPALLAALVFSVGASYTLASGLMLWPALLAGLVALRSRWGWRSLGLWVVAAVACAGLYFYNYAVVGPKIDYFWSLGHPLEYLGYIFTYLGAPFGVGISEGTAFGFGVLGGGLLVAGLAGLYFQARRAAGLWETALPWLELILFTLFNTAITGLARAASGNVQALSTRYTASSLLFWIGLIVLLVLVARPLLADFPLKVKVLVRVAAAVLLLVTSVSYGYSYSFGAKVMDLWHTRTQEGLTALYDYDHQYSQPLELLLIPGSAATIRLWAWSLEQYKEGPFSLTKEQYYSQLNDQWAQTLNPGRYQPLAYPANLMKMEQGEAATVQPTGGGIVFKHGGKLPTFIWLEDFSRFNGQVKNSSLLDPGENQALDIALKDPWYVNVVWDFGGEHFEATLLSGVPGADGLQHYRAFVPAGVKRVRLDLYYSTSIESQETLKVNLFSRN